MAELPGEMHSSGLRRDHRKKTGMGGFPSLVSRPPTFLHCLGLHCMKLFVFLHLIVIYFIPNTGLHVNVSVFLSFVSAALSAFCSSSRSFPVTPKPQHFHNSKLWGKSCGLTMVSICPRTEQLALLHPHRHKVKLRHTYLQHSPVTTIKIYVALLIFPSHTSLSTWQSQLERDIVGHDLHPSDAPWPWLVYTHTSSGSHDKHSLWLYK